MAEPRIAFKAGRCFRREGTNFVDPSPTKGAIILQNGLEDGLLHFIWKNRITNETEEDLILFPQDATFQKVNQSAWGRTYVLKFASSNQRHFFWMQDADSSRDVEFVSNVNRLLEDPQTIPIWFAPGYNPGQDAQSSSSSAPATAPVVVPAVGSSQAASSSQSASGQAHQPTQEELARLQSIIASMAGREQEHPELSLTDVLTPANLIPLFNAHPELVQTLFPHLPPDLPTPPSTEVLERIISSPQFRAAVRNLDQALRTGLLGGLVRELGLPEEAGTGIEAFLRAIQEQARSEGGHEGDSMDTD